MNLQKFLVTHFTEWSPPAPQVLNRTKYSVTLQWEEIQPFNFIADQLLYRLEKNDRTPPWCVAYRGGKNTIEINNLAPRYPHRFRLRVILKAEARHTLAERAIQFYKNEEAVYESFSKIANKRVHNDQGDYLESKLEMKTSQEGDVEDVNKQLSKPKWLESRWSQETWTNTDTDGSSATCFSMAVRCGYIKQVQGMLEERPELLGILNPTNGFPPLTIAVRKGDINMVRYLISWGAILDQPSATGQTALHIAILKGHLPIVDLLIEKGADYQARDVNGLRAEHCAVDSGDAAMLRRVMDLPGDVTVRDNNGWTPLFRALCQGACTTIIEELMVRGSDVQIADKAGLPLLSVARTITNRHGRSRDSVLRLVDSSYPHEVAVANFVRVTKKIHHVHSILKLPTLTKKPNL